MTAFLLTLALFTAWWLIGLAVLVAVRADTTSLRIALTAPAVGTAATVLPLFVLSHLGVAMEDGGPPATVALLVVSVAVLAIRRPRLPKGVVPVLAVCAGGLLLAGWPMFHFGFHWIADANDDMANYVLSATYLLHHGLMAPIDYVALSHDAGYASVSGALHRVGSRPGADITLSALSGLTGRSPQDIYMPLIFSLGMSTTCGAAALAMQAARRWWAATVAAVLVIVSPQATYGILIQLIPQVWGLGIATALCALLMRRELHRGSGAGARDVVPIGLLLAAMIVVYVELASMLALAYALYVVILVARRELDLRVAARVWVPAVAFTAFALNTYLVRELRYVQAQTDAGIRGLFPGPPNWGYMLTPGSLTGIVGFHRIPVSAGTPLLQEAIFAAALMLGGTFIAAVVTARRGDAASIVLLAFAGLGAYLAVKSSDFGLFKLYMYAQPFLAAAVAVWLAGAKRRRVLALTTIPLVLLVAVQITAQQTYVYDSLNPLAFRNASAESMLPTFRRLVESDPKPLIVVTENPTPAKLEAASVGERPLYFMSQFFFGQRNSKAARVNGWERRRFEFPGSPARGADVFWENTHATTVLATGRCTIVLPTGAQIMINRSPLPTRNGQNIVAQPCDRVRNTLVFTASTLGWGFFAFSKREAVSFYPPENDTFYPAGRTYAAFGRHVLFRVLNPTRLVRLELSLSTTNLGKALPPAAVMGESRVRLPLVGIGSGRVFSAPFQVQMIHGQRYALLDLGRDCEYMVDPRPGLLGLYGRSILLDTRCLTAFVRNISLVSDAHYRHLKRPSSLSGGFPAALTNPNLEYSGIEENGLVARDAYVVLSGGGRADLLLRGEVPTAPHNQRLRVLVNGKEVISRKVVFGHLELRVRVPASEMPRRIELRWRFAPRLPAPDGRTAAVVLRYLGLVPPGSYGAEGAPTVLERFPADLSNPALSYSGIYQDGWLKRQSSVVLAGGKEAYLVLRAQVPSAPGGQRLRVLANGRELATRNVAPGDLELRLPLPASRSPRRVELRWASAPRLPAPDGRSVSALLQFLGVVPRGSAEGVRLPSAVQHFPGDLTAPGVRYSGIWLDGWLKQQAFVILAGGPAADLLLRAQVPPAPGGQRLHVLVNGRQLAVRAVEPGKLNLRIPVPASRSPRRVELRWASAPRLPAPDGRSVSALLQFLGVVPHASR